MDARTSRGSPTVIVIFGASGDLTQRKLIPALHSLRCEGLLPEQCCVLGVARTPMSDDEFRDHLFQGVQEYSRMTPMVCQLWQQFSRCHYYLAGDYGDPGTYKQLRERLAQFDIEFGSPAGHLFYLATPPALYSLIIEQIGHAGLSRNSASWARIIIEKPYGRDLASARQLTAQVHAVFDESQVYRIDHYLGKETVQNILTLRFANAIFEPLWNRNYLDNVQITAAEDIGIEHRGRYYDQAGVVRDMLQSHLLQLLTMIAMEPPAAMDATMLRNEKVKVLDSLRSAQLSDGLLGQYRGYRSEPDVSPESVTPTYLLFKLHIDNWRWQGVPFYLRTGKKLAKKVTEVILEFKQVPHLLFPDNVTLTPNRLSFCIQPDEGIHLGIESKVPGAGMRSSQVDVAFHYSSHFGERTLADAYERLLLDAISGDASLFARNDEVERAWALVDPIITAWEQLAAPPLAFYDPGTWGPAEADEFIAGDGRVWHNDCGHR